MAASGPSVSVAEVFRFGTAIVVRLLMACAFGLITMKAGQHLAGWSAKDAVLYGEIAVGLSMFISLYIRGIPLPKIDLGPEPEETAPTD